jgi:uncharacterized protein YacL
LSDLLLALLLGGGSALVAVGLEYILSRHLSGLVPSIILGFVLGGVSAWLLLILLSFLPGYAEWKLIEAEERSLQVGLTVICSYFWVTLIIQTRHTFKLSIPYVEFKRQGRGLRVMVLDSSTLIDGRIVDLAQTHLIDYPMVMPRFIFLELQKLADNSDKLVRQRGRRGLDKAKELVEKVDVRVDESIFPSNVEVDQCLLQLTQQLDGVLMTTDYNLTQVASLEGIDTVNLNEVAQAFKSVYLPGDVMDIEMVKAGEEEAQAVGYLEDGTMVVVDRACDKIGQVVKATVTSNLQTSVGRLIFARCED